MNKSLKKALITVIVIIAVCAAIWGSLVLIRNARRGEVNVFAVSDFSTTDFNSSAGTAGTVTADKLQKVFLSETQTVKEVYVEEGQEVHVGDKLLACDSSLGAEDLHQAQIDIERQQLELKGLKVQLDKLLKAKTADQLKIEREELIVKLQKAQQEAGLTDEDNKPVLPEGDGSFEKPLCIVWDEERDALTQARLSEILGANATAYVLLLSDDGDSYGIIQGLKLSRIDGTDEIAPSIVSELQLPEIKKNESVSSLEEQIAELDEQIAEAHGKSELLMLQSAKRREIANAEIDIKIASIRLQRLRSEISDGVILSEIDGTVKALREESDARLEGTAVIEISGGGGYYIVGALSELSLGTVEIGQTVEVHSWMTGFGCEGTIAEISTDPTSNFYSWSEGNPNVSYYPMKVFVNEDADLQDGDMVDMSYNSKGSSDSWYLDSMFVRNDNGVNYVYVRNGEGLLEKRTVQTGVSSGSYTEIKSGLTMEDFIAFPYGNNIVEGAKTREATYEDLYVY